MPTSDNIDGRGKAVRWNPDEQYTSVRPVRHSYKPPAVRIIPLSIFLVVFAGCIGFIEWAISVTSPGQTNALADTTPKLAKRELITITSYDPPLTCLTQTEPVTTCASVKDLKSQVQSVDNLWSSLCAVYSTSFDPYKDQFPAALEDPFNQWTSLYHDQQSNYNSALANLRNCTIDPKELCTSEWWMMLNPTMRTTITFAVGCVKSTITADPHCEYRGSVFLRSGSITSSSIGWCGAKMASQILITTNVLRSTSASPQGQKPTPVAPSPSLTMALIPSSTTATPSLATSSLQKVTSDRTVIQTFTPNLVATVDEISSRSSMSGRPMSGDQYSAPDDKSITTQKSSLYSSSLGNSPVSNAQTFYRPGITQPTISGSPGVRGSSTSRQPENGASAALSATSGPSVLTSSTSAQSSPAIMGDPNVTFTLSAHEAIIQRPFTNITYFAAIFVPALIAVVLKVLWGIVAASLRMLEPFQRLIGGANVTAKFSLLSQYLEGAISQDIVQSLKHYRMLPICSLLIFVMLEILPLIGSISMSVKTRDKCVYQDEYYPCDPVWIINLPVIRVLEALLFFCIALIIFLIWLTRRYDIPVASNPSSFVSLASLLNHEPLLVSLQAIDPDADGTQFGAVLGEQNYHMAEHYDPESRRTRFGFMSIQHQNSHSGHDQSKQHLFSDTRSDGKAAYGPAGRARYISEEQSRLQTSRSLPISKLWVNAAVHLLTTTGMLAIAVTYLLDTNIDDAFNRFLNGDSVPAIVSKAFFVGLAIIVDMQMKNLERTVRITDPFRRLALRNARAETTVLLPLNGTCWSNLPKNLYLMCRYEFSEGRMAWPTFVSFVACLSDANIIAAAGYLFNQAQTRESYFICAYLMIACTTLILLTVLITMVWWLRVPVIRCMPRQPDTVGNILSYLCGSEIVKDWNHAATFCTPLESMSREERDSFVTRGNRTFCFGRMLGVDERERWSIDYEREDSQVMVVPKA